MPSTVIVHPPDEAGRRHVWCAGEDLGSVSTLYELMELLNRAGLNAAATAFEDTSIFEWRGGGPFFWPAEEQH